MSVLRRYDDLTLAHSRPFLLSPLPPIPPSPSSLPPLSFFSLSLRLLPLTICFRNATRQQESEKRALATIELKELKEDAEKKRDEKENQKDGNEERREERANNNNNNNNKNSNKNINNNNKKKEMAAIIETKQEWRTKDDGSKLGGADKRARIPQDDFCDMMEQHCDEYKRRDPRDEDTNKKGNYVEGMLKMDEQVTMWDGVCTELRESLSSKKE